MWWALEVMRKEGTGDPKTPDITIQADVKMREMHFERVPNPHVRFRGNTRRNSVWMSKRTNLPDEVQEGVTYRDAEVRLRIATEAITSDRDFRNSLDAGGEQKNSQTWEHKEKTESTEERE